MLVTDLAILNTVAVAVGALFLSALLSATIVSLLENEQRAARRFFLVLVVLPVPYFFFGLVHVPHQTYFSAGLITATALAGLILLTPVPVRQAEKNDVPTARIDERDVMFSRMALEAGSERFFEYYRDNPHRKALDDEFREKAGLLSKRSKHYEPCSFAAARANFEAVKSLKPLVEREPDGEAPAVDPQKMTRFIKSWARRLGAVSVGVTELRDYHLYTVVGRGGDYGKPVTLDHTFAVAFTVEMQKDMIDSAPFGPTVMESAQQYLSSGTVAVQIAEFIRNFGYPARAHIDGDYRVVCPLVARDAGLGEIGRMGLLMTPKLGPRVRIAVVTTDMPLVPDRRRYEPSTLEFCGICKKCADVCPGRAIPLGARGEIEGACRWQINSEACFTYWCVIGTDCARCVKACPYSHPDNFVHNSVRTCLTWSPVFRRFALKMDDFFYGRKPASSEFPEWMKL